MIKSHDAFVKLNTFNLENVPHKKSKIPHSLRPNERAYFVIFKTCTGYALFQAIISAFGCAHASKMA